MELIISIIVIIVIIVAFMIVRNFKRDSKDSTVDENETSKAWHPINMYDYSNYIFVHNSTEKYILERIDLYGELLDGKKKSFELKHTTIYDWTVIACPKEFTFYDYHNLTSWLLGTNDELDRPDITVAISLHEWNDNLSYYATLDKESWGDTLVGVFNDGKKFSIFLPESYEEKGNIRVDNNNLTVVGVKEYMRNMGVVVNKLIDEVEKSYKVKDVEISIQ